MLTGLPQSVGGSRLPVSAPKKSERDENDVLLSHRGMRPRNESMEEYTSPEKDDGMLTERQTSSRKGLNDRFLRLNSVLSEMASREFNETASEKYSAAQRFMRLKRKTVQNLPTA